jgi:DNA adenine methylase
MITQPTTQTARSADERRIEKNYRVKPAVSWPGGKSRLLKHILPLIPEHTCYAEPFSGGLAVLLAKPRSEVEVINDLNGDLITFYRCVRFHADVLLTELEFVLHSREEFHDFRAQPGLTDIQRAARWYYRNKECFGGADMRSFGVRVSSSMGSRAARMDAIRALNVRLDKVCIEHLDWTRVVDLYDRPSSFFFIDPPYTECGATMYEGWTNTDVQILRDRIAKIRGQWMVTLNDTPAILAIFKGCKILPVTRPLGINGKGNAGGRSYKELIITP